MSMDGITLHFIKNELNAELTGAKIQKIYQPASDQLVIHTNRYGQKRMLLLSIHPTQPGCHFTEAKYPNPDTPPMFCMLLRKHLTGATVTKVDQVGLDRILKIRFETYNELGNLSHLTLVIEIMGRHSNIILLETETERIIDSIIRIGPSTSSFRIVLPKQAYIAPPQPDKKDFLSCDYNIESLLLEYFSRDLPLSKVIFQLFTGMGNQFAEEILLRAGLRPSMRPYELTPAMIQALKEAIDYLKQEMTEQKVSPTVYFDPEGAPMDFTPFLFRCYESYPRKQYESMSQAIDQYYDALWHHKVLEKKRKNLTDVVKKHLSKQEKKLKNQREDLLKTDGYHRYQVYGEVLLANAYTFREQPVGSVSLPNFYDENYTEIKIPIPPGKDIYQAADGYFKKYKKLKGTEAFLLKDIPKVEEEVTYLENILFSLTMAKSMEELHEVEDELLSLHYLEEKRVKGKPVKRERSTSSPYCIQVEGYTVYAGRNNIQNDRITFKLADDEDTWFHARNIPGSHVVIKNPAGETIPDSVLLTAARIAGYLSKFQNDVYVEVDYTLVKYVKKIKGAKPGMVIYDKFSTIRADISRSAVEELLSSSRDMAAF